MHERDRLFILADVKNYVLDEGAYYFLRDLQREFPDTYKKLERAFSKKRAALLEPYAPFL